MHPLVKLAKDSVEFFTHNQESPTHGELSHDLPQDMLSTKAGVFVSIKKHGKLRGCIGTFSPTTDSIAQETVRNAVVASTEDPRFSAVLSDELDDLTYSVDVLSPPEPVADKSELNPKKYGVIVSKGRHKGLLLPDLQGVDTVQEQLGIALMKAGLSADEQDIYIQRFEVRRYK